MVASADALFNSSREGGTKFDWNRGPPSTRRPPRLATLVDVFLVGEVEDAAGHVPAADVARQAFFEGVGRFFDAFPLSPEPTPAIDPERSRRFRKPLPNPAVVVPAFGSDAAEADQSVNQEDSPTLDPDGDPDPFSMPDVERRSGISIGAGPASGVEHEPSEAFGCVAGPISGFHPKPVPVVGQGPGRQVGARSGARSEAWFVDFGALAIERAFDPVSSRHLKGKTWRAIAGSTRGPAQDPHPGWRRVDVEAPTRRRRVRVAFLVDGPHREGMGPIRKRWLDPLHIGRAGGEWPDIEAAFEVSAEVGGAVAEPGFRVRRQSARAEFDHRLRGDAFGRTGRHGAEPG